MGKLIVNIGLFFGTLILLLVVVEGTSRYLMPQWTPPGKGRTDFWEYDAFLGWAQKPGHQGRFEHRDFSVGVQINSRGLRDREYELEKEAGTTRILLLGDSFGWGFGVEQSDVLDQRIEQAYPNIEIINASVNGYGTDQAYLYLKEKGLRYHPDVILLLFHPNDFINNSHPEQYYYNKPVFRISGESLLLQNNPVPLQDWKQRSVSYIIGQTYFLRQVYIALGQIDQKVFGSAIAPKVMPASGQLYSIQHDITTALLRAMKDLTDSQNMIFVVASIPMNGNQRAFLSDFLDQEQILHIPLDEVFAHVDTPVTFEHDPHWNSAGHRIAAEAIAEGLKSFGILVEK
jgi:hypothetical protein